MPGDGSNSPSIAAIPAPPDHVKMRGANDPDLNHLKDRRTFCLLKRDAQGNEGFLSQSELPPGMKKQLQEAKLSLLQDRKKATFVLIFSEDGKILEIIHGDSKHRLEIDDDIDRQLENILAR